MLSSCVHSASPGKSDNKGWLTSTGGVIVSIWSFSACSMANILERIWALYLFVPHLPSYILHIPLSQTPLFPSNYFLQAAHHIITWPGNWLLSRNLHGALSSATSLSTKVYDQVHCSQFCSWEGVPLLFFKVTSACVSNASLSIFSLHLHASQPIFKPSAGFFPSLLAYCVRTLPYTSTDIS